MRNIFIITLLVSLFSSPVWSEPITLDDLVVRNDIYYKKFTDKPFSGKVSGRSSGILKKGKKVGVWNMYHPNGQLFLKQKYKKGVLNGLTEVYYKDGSISDQINYKNGKESGTYEKYRKDGSLIERGVIQLDKNEKTYERFWSNGNLRTRGTLKLDGVFTKGIGSFETYFSDGSIEVSGQYDEEGNDTGVWKGYYENGNLRMVSEWKGEMEYVEYFNEDGSINPEISGVYKNKIKQE